MKNKIQSEILILFVLVFGLILFYIATSSVFLNFNNDLILLSNLNPLSIASTLLFILISSLALLSDRNYLFFLPFMLLAMPSPVDDLLPSICLTAPNDVRTIFFPLFTHIDIYLLIGILRKAIISRPKNINSNLFTLIVLGLVMVVLTINLFLSSDVWDFYLLLSHTYHFRYLVLLLILSHYYSYINFENQILFGIIFSVIFLLFESVINTYVSDLDRLTSGTLSVNSYANIISSIMIYFIWLKKYKKISNRVIYFLLMLSLMILLGTQTRMAFLSPILVFISYSFYYLKKNFLIRLFKLLASATLLLSLYLFLVKTDVVSKRYSIENIFVMDFSNSKFELEKNSESSSLFTRFMLFKTSFEMIKDKPLTGIGVGRFNRYKKDFGFKYNVLIDSHNDLLALMCQYGILTGLLLLFIITILPLIYYLRYLKGNINNKLVFLFIINFSMLFAGLSNAGLLKHQIFAFLAFNLIVTNSLVSSLKIR